MTGDVRRPAVFAAPATPSHACPPPPPGSSRLRPLREPRPAAPSSAGARSPLEVLRAHPSAGGPERRRRGVGNGRGSRPPRSSCRSRLRKRPSPLSAPFDAPAAEADTLPDFIPPPPPASEIGGRDQLRRVGGRRSGPGQPAVRHVKVRSSVDILSELDKLRKISTQKASAGSGPAPRSEPGRARASDASIDDLLTSNLNHKKDVTRSFDLTIPRHVLGRSRQVTIELKFSDGTGSPLPTDSSFSIDLSSSADLQKLLLSLRFNVQAE